jgi:ATP-dependent DNA helicase RecG
MVALRSDSPIQYVKGIGPTRAEWFATLGIRTVGDLLEYFPFRHESDRGEVAIEDLVPGANVTIRGEVVEIGGRRPALRCEIDDGTGTCVLRWFDQRFGGRGLFRGATVVATGRVQLYDGLPELVHPRVQVFEPGAVLLSQPAGPQRVGVYRGNETIKSPLIRRALLTVLSQSHLPVDEALPPRLLAKHKLPSREQAIRHMHCPTSDAELARARTRLAYEEFLLMELAMALRRRKRLALLAGQKLHVTPEIEKRIRARFPFTLTASQDEAVAEIVRDLQGGRPMTRLLQGDVGSGKTVVALYACLIAIANGKQAAIMAPTEILAHQHFTNIDHYLRDSRVRYVLLRGKLGKKERAETLAAIERGEIDLVVGTQALIQKDVAFNHLAVVIVDEQHKFGVLQRHEFRTKGPMPHYLVMTATPIPRTLAMTVFGDLDVSLIKQPPPGRGRIITKIVTGKQWETVMGYVRQRLEKGEQAYVVCPLIGREEATQKPEASIRAPSASDGPGSAGLTAVTEAYRRLSDGPWRGLNMGLLHGSLRSAEKQAAIEAFAAGRSHAVVATTVVEVGVDVPNATIMIVEHAERYGLSQLHQLRGRVGRGSKDSLCVLIAHGRGEKAAERLEVMAQTTDGFQIAEADLRQRGPGQLFGTRQHGLPELHVASIVDDFTLLEKARQDAFDIVAKDPTLKQSDHQSLIPALKRMFGQKLALIDAA